MITVTISIMSSLVPKPEVGAVNFTLIVQVATSKVYISSRLVGPLGKRCPCNVEKSGFPARLA